MNYAVGHNVAGYLPDGEMFTTGSFARAKAYLIHQLLFEADYAETETIAEELSAAAEDVNLWSGPDVCYVEMIDSEHCIPTAWWIMETEEDCEEES